jgi:hypothetical protein
MARSSSSFSPCPRSGTEERGQERGRRWGGPLRRAAARPSTPAGPRGQTTPVQRVSRRRGGVERRGGRSDEEGYTGLGRRGSPAMWTLRRGGKGWGGLVGRGEDVGGVGREWESSERPDGRVAERWRRRPCVGRRGQRHSGVERVGWGDSRRRGETRGHLRRRGEGQGTPEPRRNRGGRGELRRKEEGAEDSGGLGRQVRSV